MGPGRTRRGAASPKRAWPLALTLALVLLSSAAVPSNASLATSAPARPDQATVQTAIFAAETGHNIADLRLDGLAGGATAGFLSYYRRTGAFARWGAPRSEAHWAAGDALVQYFANGILEARPLAADPAQREVTRRLVWDFIGGGEGSSVDLGAESERLSDQPGVTAGPWNHRISNLALDGTATGFLDTYRALRGAASFGLPKSEARVDTHEPGTLFLPGAETGVIRQYFQAGVLEFRSDQTPTVRILALGDTLRDRDFPQQTYRHLVAFARATPLAPGASASLDLLTRPAAADASTRGLFEYALPSVARVAGNGGCGSGFFIDSGGHLVTNQHVVAGSQRVSVTLADNRRFFGWVADADITNDLAVVRVPGLVSVPLGWGESDQLIPGDNLAVVGFPATLVGNQLDCPADPVVTAGVFTADVTFFGLPHLQTDSAINPGNSGGPALDSRGRVVGLTVSQLVNSQNTSFLIPQARAAPRVAQMLDRIATGFEFESVELIADRIAAQDAAVRGVAWSPDGGRLASASDDGTVAITDLASGRSRPILRGHDDTVRAVAWSPGGERLVSGSDDRSVIVWSAGGEIRHVLSGHRDRVRAVAWSPTSDLIASGSDDGSVRTWDASTGVATQRLETSAGGVRAVAWSPDGGLVAGGTTSGVIVVWDAASGRPLITLQAAVARINALAWSPGGSSLLAGDADGTLRVWNPATRTVIQTIEGHGGQVTGVAWSPRADQYVSASTDGAVKVWDLTSGRLVAQLTRFPGAVLDAAWSPDASSIAGGLDSGVVRIWNAP